MDVDEIRFRPMGAQDLGRVPMDCHGTEADLARRVETLGAAAILAFDGDQHVGQLQFRLHDQHLRSATGVFSPDYWGDFGGRGAELPERTLAIYCYHVGQLTAGKDRDPRYLGRGLGGALLDHFIDWADANGFSAIVAKAMPADPGVMQFMGGQPEHVYAGRGFVRVDRWTDREMHAALVERDLVARDSNPDEVASVGMYLRRSQT